MTEDLQIKLALQKAGSLGKAQSAYSWGAIASALLSLLAGAYESLSMLSDAAPFVASLSLMAWFGIGRASGQVGAKLKDLIPDYNYGTYGGAPGLIWSIFYAPHGQGRTVQRSLALMSFPVTFGSILAYHWASIPLLEMSNLAMVQAALLLIPSWQTLRLWANRIKAI